MPTASNSGPWLTGRRIYPQIAERLRTRITSGAYPADSVLPSEAELGREFRVARNTVRRGLAILENEGLIVTIPSKGRVVTGGRDEGTSYRYEVIAGDLRDAIKRGELAAVPSELTLRRRYSASRNTVRQALAVLEQEGLIHAVQGRGRFIRSKPSDP
ncbi:GntR family transcriptional regulator [Nonomuraea typhae]|uniref:GntR family transcriptional regulator n=1 Tax=Nonomuraea typhae TaxID=2603600 RepID=UPI001FED1F2E|nr:GntR family transcriptional regulator [Nonomuraea typhae]